MEGNLPFLPFLLCIWGQLPSTSPRGGLYSEGRFTGGFFAVQVWGGLYLEGLYIYGSCIALHCKSEKYFYMNTLLNDSCYHCIIKKIVL